MKKTSDLLKNKDDLEIDVSSTMEVYKHINDMYKFYTNLRFILLGASIGVFSFILTNFSNKDLSINKYLYIILGLIASIVFFLMDLRTKQLFRETRQAGKDIENNYMKIKGFYTHVEGIKSKLSHSIIIGTSYVMIMVFFLYILIVS
ncbi:hypothetical protein GCM10028806_56700 [Spirosoma terrae]|uniref:Uncharacterized protein n=1 Tax=Spirosoma terrae TaxID=1968276 RepID=A0A6L9LF61_9BACT|nr:hypothetical protein [Spirosoma terrae]NDU99245.1 hypothetical protein [Spirosoma terrae]